MLRAVPSHRLHHARRKAQSVRLRPLMLLALIASGSGCIAAHPSLSGGATTPSGRVDMAFGGAARVPLGALRDVAGVRGDHAVQRTALGEGVTPIGFGRYGINRHTDVELAVLGASVRVAYRHEWLLSDGINRTVWLVSPSLLLGKAHDREADGARGGLRSSLEVPLLYSADYGGVYETWIGPRVGLEYIKGDFTVERGISSVHASGLRAGAVLGFVAGFRRIHAMIELGAAYEHWWMRADGERRQRGGVVLIPAFALRVRL
jgi:hypothetical protein